MQKSASWGAVVAFADTVCMDKLYIDKESTLVAPLTECICEAFRKETGLAGQREQPGEPEINGRSRRTNLTLQPIGSWIGRHHHLAGSEAFDFSFLKEEKVGASAPSTE
jgi:hypothetical protein